MTASSSAVSVDGYDDLVEIGRGATSVVYRAIQQRIARPVALKVITSELDDQGSERFERECRTLGALAWHPHIVVVHEAGLDARELAGTRRPWLAMEYLEGGSLHDRLRSSGPVGWQEAVTIGVAVAEALDALHDCGVLHRDVKPANILYGRSGVPKLADFGIVAEPGTTRALAGYFLGTMAYAPPEHLNGVGATPVGDVYSLAATLHELMVGRPPFVEQGMNPAELQQRIMTRPADDLRVVGAPDDLAALVARALAKDPEARPDTARAFALELRAIAGDGAGVRRSPSAAEPGGSDDGSRTPSAATGSGDRDRSPGSSSAPTSARATPSTRSPLPPALVRGGLDFIGRDDERRVLGSVIDAAAAGSLAVGLVQGDPGIGKTGLLGAAARAAQHRGLTVLYGRCPEIPLGALPAFVEAIDPVLGQFDPDEVGARTELTHLFPELGRMASAPASPAPAPHGDVEQDQARLILGVLDLLRSLADDRAVLLVLDDLHWADDTTLRALSLLAERVADCRFALFGSYRDAGSGNPALVAAIDRLRRSGTVEVVTLHGLHAESADVLIERILGPVEPELAAALLERTQGHPLFVQELCRRVEDAGVLADGTGPAVDFVNSVVPEGVKAVVRQRVHQLDATAAELLALGSVCGPEFELATVAAVGGFGDDQALDAIDSALAAHLVVEAPGGRERFAFAHALVRETLYESFSPPRLRRLHRRIADQMEMTATGEPTQLIELARHLLQSDPSIDIDRVLSVAIGAAEASAAALAFDQARSLYAQALDLLDRNALVYEAQIAEVLIGLARTQRATGEADAARGTCRQAIEVARRLDDGQLLARAVLELVWLHPATPFVLRSSTKANEESEQLLALLGEAAERLTGAAPHLRAALDAHASLLISDDDAAKERLAIGALREAERAGVPELIGVALQAKLSAEYDPGRDPGELLDDIERMAEMAERSGRSEQQAYAAALRLQCYLELGDADGLEVAHARYVAVARSSYLPLLDAFAESLAAMRALSAGDFASSELHAAVAVDRSGSDENFVLGWAVQTAVSRLWQGDLDDVLPSLEVFVAQYSDNPAWHAAMAVCFAEAHQPERAGDALAAARRGFAVAERDSWWPVTAAMMTEAAALLAHPSAAELEGELAAFTGRGIVIGPSVVYLGAADRFLGLAQTAAGHRADARASFERAIAFHRALQAAPLLAQSLHGAAVVTDDRVLARAHLDEAGAIASALGMANLAHRVDTTRAEL